MDLEPDRAEAVAGEISQTGAAFPVVGDVRRTEDVERVVAEARQALGGIDVLVTVVGGHNAFAPWQPCCSTKASVAPSSTSARSVAWQVHPTMPCTGRRRPA